MRTLLIELSDSEYAIVTEEELREIERSAEEFDGFTGCRVVGYCDELTKKGE